VPTPRRAVLLVALLALSACGPEVYQAHGEVRELHPEEARVVVAHGEIPGFMDAMSMSFDVPDPALLERLEVGQVIDFRIEYDGRRARIVAFETAAPADSPR
jgi:Cu/Ag efflux protein CusF